MSAGLPLHGCRYATTLSASAAYSSAFPAYDGVAHTRARYFLPARNEAARAAAARVDHNLATATSASTTGAYVMDASGAAATNSSSSSTGGGSDGPGMVETVAGGPLRWLLPADMSGLQGAANMYTEAGQLYQLYVSCTQGRAGGRA